MSNSVDQVPEVASLHARGRIVRVPPELDVPFTPRVARLVDTAAFRRLARISQLGLVSLVYPGATHSRFEHTLGAYYCTLRYLDRLSQDERFRKTIGAHEASVLIAAALLHDLGHWPFCHPIEDMHLDTVPRHEALARTFLADDGELAGVLRDHWGVYPDEVLALLLAGRASTSERHGPNDCQKSQRLLRSILSGPIDVDKMDYLQRDSLHAGVPYGRHFDQNRLIGSLVVNQRGDGLAISEKGKTAAELMVFARYVMFSEVYWHHAVRSATAMLARAFYELHERLNLADMFEQTESELIATLRSAARKAVDDDAATSNDRSAATDDVVPLVEGIFGARRALYKRVAEFSVFQEPDLYRRLARRPYPWLVRCARHLSRLLSKRSFDTPGTDKETGPIAATEILIDAPPVQREVEFDVEIYFAKEDTYRPLESVSPVVEALARRQFDDYVKRVRIFSHPRIAADLVHLPSFGDIVGEAAEATDARLRSGS